MQALISSGLFSRSIAVFGLLVLIFPTVAFADETVRSCCIISRDDVAAKCFQMIDTLPGTPTEPQKDVIRVAQHYQCQDVPLQYEDHRGQSAEWIVNDQGNSGVCGTLRSTDCSTIPNPFSTPTYQLHARCTSVSDCINQTAYVCQSNLCKLKEGQSCTGSDGSTVNCASGLLCRSTFEGFKCLTPEADVNPPAGAAGSSPSTQEPTPFTPVVPVLGVPIPGFEFTPATEVDGVVSVPYLSQYINAIYRYMTAIVLTVAIVMVMIGGFKYLLAATPMAVKDGKKTISDALIGMMLVLGAYVILNTVNPALISLETLSFRRVDSMSFALDTRDEDTGEPSTVNGSQSASSGSVLNTSAAVTRRDLPAGIERRAATLADCRRLKEMVSGGYVNVSASDRAGINAMNADGVIRIPRNRRDADWTDNAAGVVFDDANGVSMYHARDGQNYSVFLDEPAAGVQVVPSTCKFLADLGQAKKIGDYTGTVYVTIIGAHNRCGNRERVACAEEVISKFKATNAQVTDFTLKQSDHWTGSGLDFGGTFGQLQEYVVSTFVANGVNNVAKVIGPTGLTKEQVGCQGTRATDPDLRVSSPYSCLNGRCPYGYKASTQCQHFNHTHISIVP